MRRIAKLVRWGSPVVALFLIGQVLFTGQVLISKANGLIMSGKPSAAFWSNCLNIAHQQATHPQTPEPSPLDNCYQTLLEKFGIKFLQDIIGSTNPAKFLTALQKMKAANQQPSVAKVAVQMGYKGDPYALERQDLILVDKGSVEQGKVDPKVVKDYNAAIDRLLFNQFVKQQLPVINKQSLDLLFTHAILATQPTIQAPTQPSTIQDCKGPLPTLNPAPRIDAPDSNHTGDLTYNGGHVVDRIANVYLIFWQDASVQRASPKYVSLQEQFVRDISQSPLYRTLMQYHDGSGRCPTGARLAGSFVDIRPFPQDLLADHQNSKLSGDDLHQADDNAMRQEIASVAKQKGWSIQDYHNVYGILPILDDGGFCGAHNWLHIGADGKQNGSPFMFLPYPHRDGQDQCSILPQSPNDDHIADIMTGIISHELLEAVSDPYVDGWSGNGGEMADKCPLPPDTIDPKTNSNVTWNGHHYLLQEEYDNHQHGCVLQGP